MESLLKAKKKTSLKIKRLFLSGAKTQWGQCGGLLNANISLIKHDQIYLQRKRALLSVFLLSGTDCSDYLCMPKVNQLDLGYLSFYLACHFRSIHYWTSLSLKGSQGCLMTPPVWNLWAVTWFHLTISSLVLHTPIALFLPTGPFSRLFSGKFLLNFLLKDRLFCLALV